MEDYVLLMLQYVCLLWVTVHLVPKARSWGEHFWPKASMWNVASHDRLVVDFCPTGQEEFNQRRATQAHHCQNQPGLLLQVLHSRSQGEAVLSSAPVSSLMEPNELHRVNKHTMKTALSKTKSGEELYVWMSVLCLYQYSRVSLRRMRVFGVLLRWRTKGSGCSLQFEAKIPSDPFHSARSVFTLVAGTQFETVAFPIQTWKPLMMNVICGHPRTESLRVIVHAERLFVLWVIWALTDVRWMMHQWH